MHPRIEELYNVIKNRTPQNVLDKETLLLLKEYGCTKTEAAITIYLGFKINDTEADAYVAKSGIWPNEDIQDVFFQTLKYLYYNPDDPKYKADDDSVTVSI